MKPFKNSQWVVTDWGLETCPPEAKYEIKASRLLETTTRSGATFYDWPIHLAEKEWVNLAAFAEAFTHALSAHAGTYSGRVDPIMLKASILQAQRERRALS